MWMLDNIRILRDLDKKELSNLELLCQERFLKAGEILFREWDESSTMYLLSKWKIEIFINKDNKEIILWEVKAENILWEMSIFWEKHKRMASARAKEDSVVIVLLEFAIKELVSKYPEILEKIIDIIKQRKEQNKKLI